MLGAAAERHYERASSLFTTLAYSDSDHLFLNSDQTLGFMFECIPFAGHDQRAADRMNVLLNNDWPADTSLQFILYASPNIYPALTRQKALRAGLRDPLLAETVQVRAKFFERGIAEPLETSGVRVRDLRLYVTCKFPTVTQVPSDEDIARARTLHTSVKKALETVGLHPSECDNDKFVQLMTSMLNHGTTASWATGNQPVADEDKPLREQLLDYDKKLTVDAEGLRVGDSFVKTLSFKRFPEFVFFGGAASYLGDYMTGARGMRENLIISATLQFPDQQATKASLATKRQWAVKQAYGPLLQFVPVLAAKKKGFDIIDQALEAGDRPVRFYMSIVLFAPSKEAAVAAVSNARSYWGEMGFQAMEDRYFCLPFFLHSLPFGTQFDATKDLFRFKTMATRHAIPLLPLFGDWRGTGTPILNFVSRNGQIMDVSLFDSGTNFNCCIAAQSGSGKSFLTNDIISSYLSVGGKAWVIDVGYSYRNLCETFEGDFIEFSTDSRICLNPFQIVNDYKEEADTLIALLAAMAAPTEKLTDLQVANLRRIVTELWEKRGHDLVVDDVAAACKAESDRRIVDLGEQLYPFTLKGEYGRFFNGDNNVSFQNRFSVLELEELKSRKHLQQVVLLQLIYQIQHDMYMGERDRPKLTIIDEAWDLLANGGDAVRAFIEHGYRRFRKYGGSAVTITQGVNDLYASATGRAIVENSANMYLLGQKPTAINALKAEGRLPLTDGGFELLKTIHTVPGSYSEIFFITEMGMGIGRLIVDKFRQLLYSTKAEDVNAIKRQRQKGLNVAEAIEAVLRERGHAE